MPKSHHMQVSGKKVSRLPRQAAISITQSLPVRSWYLEGTFSLRQFISNLDQAEKRQRIHPVVPISTK